MRIRVFELKYKKKEVPTTESSVKQEAVILGAGGHG